MTPLVVVVDTCALFPLTLRDVLLRAAEADLFELRWSEEILVELQRNLCKDRGLSEEQARHLITELRRAFPEAIVTGYENLIESMTNAPEDRHIVATAVHAGAGVIVTDNVKDFREGDLAPYDVEVHTPDEFLEGLYRSYPERLARIVLELNAVRKKPPEPLQSTLSRLAKSTPRFVVRIREHAAVRLVLERENQ